MTWLSASDQVITHLLCCSITREIWIWRRFSREWMIDRSPNCDCTEFDGHLFIADENIANNLNSGWWIPASWIFQFFYSVLWLRNLTDISSLSTEIPPVTDIQDGGRRHLGFFRKFDIGLQWSISVPNLKDIYSLLMEIPPITEIQDGGHAILNFPKSSILAYRNLHLYPIWRTYLHWQREYGRKSKFKTAAIHIWNAVDILPVTGRIAVRLYDRLPAK